MSYFKRFMLLGSGELGREFVIAAKRLGCYVVAVDRYANAPAMQLADCNEVINMFDGNALEEIVRKHKPDFIVPEIEAINIDKLLELEKQGYNVVPCAKAVQITMDRKALRLLATKLGLKTADYTFASTLQELKQGCSKIGFPCVVKPLMSSSGKGQTVCKTAEDISIAWNNLEQSRGDSTEAIIEQFIEIDTEITVLTISTRQDEVFFCQPIGHIQSKGDYQESWQPEEVGLNNFEDIRYMIDKIVRQLGGVGLWGAEFFISKEGEIYFSEISPRPHDTGMVTLANTQHLNQFELHLYAILGIEIVNDWGVVKLLSKGASNAICYQKEVPIESTGIKYKVDGISDAIERSSVNTRVFMFSKPVTYHKRRLGVIVSSGHIDKSTTDQLRRSNTTTRKRIKINPR